MADETPAEIKSITFSVKSSNDQKFSVTVPDSMTVAELKTKLSTSEYADVPAERQRLIYSGRVLKDSDKLSAHNIKDGNTVHMVKGAATSSSQGTQGSGASSGSGQTLPAAAIPQNIAAGTGGDPMSNLTGARYAGFAQMPGASMFGPDGGMGPPPGPDELLSMLDNPMFQSQMNEAMNNPDIIRMMTNSPMVQNNPMMRQALQNPEFRRMLMDPQMIRASMQMSRMMGGGGNGQGSMPAPGVTDTTPGGNATSTQSPEQRQNTTSQPQFNPFQFMGQGQGQGQGSNPFAALFGGSGQTPSSTTNTTGTTTAENTSGNQNQTTSQTTQQQQPNPFANLFGGGMPGGQQPQQGMPFNNMMQTMMSNPQMMQAMMQDMQNMYGGGNQNAGVQTGQQGQQGQGQSAFNPFSLMGQGGFGSAPPQQDSRPPEEVYADQLRQLNEMGFYEFDRNIRALRMAGGSVQGAVEMLLGGTV